MENVHIDGDDAEITFNGEFYNREAIEDTVEAFSENFEVSKDGEGENFKVNITNKRNVKTSDVAYQFLNFVLSQMKKTDRII